MNSARILRRQLLAFRPHSPAQTFGGNRVFAMASTSARLDGTNGRISSWQGAGAAEFDLRSEFFAVQWKTRGTNTEEHPRRHDDQAYPIDARSNLSDNLVGRRF